MLGGLYAFQRPFREYVPVEYDKFPIPPDFRQPAEFVFARLMYLSLYKQHELAVHGIWRTTLGTASRLLTSRTEPRVKLH